MYDTINELTSLYGDVEVLWSTLEALSAALSDKDAPAELFQPAVLGVADRAFSIKGRLICVIEDMDKK